MNALGSALGVADVGDEEEEDLNRPKGIKGLALRVKGWYDTFYRYKDQGGEYWDGQDPAGLGDMEPENTSRFLYPILYRIVWWAVFFYLLWFVVIESFA